MRRSIVDHFAKGDKAVVLRPGTNGWTCTPDIPSTPTNDPVCADRIALTWLQAWMNQTQPPAPGPIGVSYMLQGGNSASNSDPSMVRPPAGGHWMIEPPHLMLFGMNIDHSVYSDDHSSGGPWIMFSGTKYEHLMVSVK